MLQKYIFPLTPPNFLHYFNVKGLYCNYSAPQGMSSYNMNRHRKKCLLGRFYFSNLLFSHFLVTAN